MTEEHRRGVVLVELVRLVVVAALTAAGHQVADGLVEPVESRWIILGAVLGAMTGYVLGGILGRSVARLIGVARRQFQRLPGADIVAGGLGLIAGLIIAGAIGWPLLFVPERAVGLAGVGFLIVVIGALGYAAGTAKREDILQLFGLAHRTRASDLKVLDTSAVIDARLLECVRAGFIRGTLLIGQFVLEEVQSIADSSDQIRRNRGRRGLEMLGALKRENLVDLRFVDRHYPEFGDVDAKVVAMARERGAGIVTSDVALGRIAELQGIEVLSLNALSEALRRPLLPGEEILVQIAREGREPGQGVGYLEDGSMVVVDGGREMIGATANVVVTSVIQTSGGRMIFGKPNPEP